MRWLVRLAWLQGVYFAATAVWALVHVESFMAVTGPKTDVWLVKTVAILLLAIGIVLLVAALRLRIAFEVALLALASALGLAVIDVVYATRGVISDVYLLDALAELALVVLWLAALWRARGESALWGEGAWTTGVPQGGKRRPRARRPS